MNFNKSHYFAKNLQIPRSQNHPRPKNYLGTIIEIRFFISIKHLTSTQFVNFFQQNVDFSQQLFFNSFSSKTQVFIDTNILMKMSQIGTRVSVRPLDLIKILNFFSKVEFHQNELFSSNYFLTVIYQGEVLFPSDVFSFISCR